MAMQHPLRPERQPTAGNQNVVTNRAVGPQFDQRNTEMTDDSVVVHLQRIAVDLEYDHNLPDPIKVILNALRETRPEAASEQIVLAIRRAITELELRVAAVNGWYLKYDETDPRWQWLELMKDHIILLGEAQLSVKA